MCCLQEGKWKGRGARFMGVKGRRYSCGGLGIVMVREVWEFWSKRKCVRWLWSCEERATE